MTTIFRNKTWLVTWVTDTEIRVEKITLPIAAHGVSTYAIRYSDGRIAYDHPGWVPDYVKEHVTAAFEGYYDSSSRKKRPVKRGKK